MPGLVPAMTRVIPNPFLLLDHAQIGTNRKRIVVAELELGHVGMAARDSALKPARKFVKIDAAAERPERRRIGVAAFAPGADRMAAAAKLGHQRLAASDWILRLG